MDYTISKSIDGATPRVVYTFTQASTGGRAKQAAKDKFLEMWMRIVSKPTQFRSLMGNDSEFSYNMSISTEKTVNVRFFIAPLKKKRGSAT